MVVSKDLTLTTERLLLRPIQSSDEEELWQAIWSDADVTRYLPSRKPVPRHVIPGYVERTNSHWELHGLGVWAVRRSADGGLIGHCGLVINEAPDVELIYALARSAWGQGFATEAAECVTNFAFDRRELQHLYALVFPENLASVRVLEKLRFEPDGTTERFDAELLRYIRRK